jgi:peptidoglycan/LPS O-acetylase OafA/YrhL
VPPPEISNGVLMPLLGLVLFGLAYSKSQLWANPYFVRLGDASYSMYLLHIPLFQWLGAIDKRVLDLQDRHFVSFFILYLSAVIGASLLSLKYVEEPSRIVIRRCFSQKRAPLAVNARDRAGV